MMARFVYSPLNYWGSLIGDSTMAVTFLGFGLWLQRSSAEATPLRCLVALSIGWLLASLLEYLVHRYLFHGPRSLAQEGHAEHHADAHVLLASPFFAVPLFQVLLWWLTSLWVGSALAAIFMAGGAAGYAAFSLVHHGLHQLEKRSAEGPEAFRWPALERLHRNHVVHHRMAHYNFGTTTSLWDRVFGTYRRPGLRA